MAAEKQFENRLKKFLEDEGCWHIKFFANAYTKSGIPDILCSCYGAFLAIEVKAPNGKPSELQKWNIKKINDGGGFGVVLFPDQFDLFKEMVGWIKKGEYRLAHRVVSEINERWDK